MTLYHMSVFSFLEGKNNNVVGIIICQPLNNKEFWNQVNVRMVIPIIRDAHNELNS
jgi:hypothetical protein